MLRPKGLVKFTGPWNWTGGDFEWRTGGQPGSAGSGKASGRPPGCSLDLLVFTGLVQHVGVVSSVAQRGALVRMAVDGAGWAHAPARGDSICISGCCLTLAEPMAEGSGLMAFDIVPETLTKTKLGRLVPGDCVNLEHSVTASTLMGGHVVQGHVDGVGVVAAVQTGDDWRISFHPPLDLMPYFVPKGSVCIDGVSLTLAAVDAAAGIIGVALIPETLAKTTLGRLKQGDTVNLEADVLVKTVVHTLRHFMAHSSGLPTTSPGTMAGTK